MGVLACDREGCDNIMCDTLLSADCREFYCCDECLAELEDARKAWPEDTTVGDVQRLIVEFMESQKGSQFPSTDSEDIEQEFRSCIRRRR